jgi:hypothetical protein
VREANGPAILYFGTPAALISTVNRVELQGDSHVLGARAAAMLTRWRWKGAFGRKSWAGRLHTITWATVWIGAPCRVSLYRVKPSIGVL